MGGVFCLFVSGYAILNYWDLQSIYIHTHTQTPRHKLGCQPVCSITAVLASCFYVSYRFLKSGHRDSNNVRVSVWINAKIFCSRVAAVPVISLLFNLCKSQRKGLRGLILKVGCISKYGLQDTSEVIVRW